MKSHPLLLAVLSIALLATADTVTAQAIYGSKQPVYNPGQAGAFATPIAVEGWGMGLVGGVFCLDDVSKNFATPLGSLNANISFDKGWGVVVPVNYQFADGLSLGFSAGYEKAHFNEFSATLGGITGSADLDGKLSLVPLMANVGYYVPLTDSLTWNFGGGAGGVRIETLMVGDPVSDVTWNLGFQAFTGLNLAVSPQAVLNLGYRYTLAKDTVADLSGHLVEAGVTFRF